MAVDRSIATMFTLLLLLALLLLSQPSPATSFLSHPPILNPSLQSSPARSAGKTTRLKSTPNIPSYILPAPAGVKSGALPKSSPWKGLDEFVVAHVSGRQYLLRKNCWYDLDYVKNLGENGYLYLHKILLIAQKDRAQFGTPFLKNVVVPLKFMQHIRQKKIIIFKTRPKKHYRRKNGFRRRLTRVYFPWTEMPSSMPSHEESV